MPKTKKSSSSKKWSSSKTGKSGVKSNRFTQKSRNLDYKYHIQVRGDTFDFTRMDIPFTQCIIPSGTALFIPLSTYEMIAKSMRVSCKFNIPWAYAVFQNTAQLQSAMAQRLVPQTGDGQAEYKRQTGRNCYVWDCGVQMNSILNIPITGQESQDWASLTNLKDANSFFVQLCKAQSTYGECTYMSQSNIYSKTISVYNQKATQYLNGSQQRTNVFLDKVYYDPDGYEGSLSSGLFMKECWQKCFYSNDMILVIFPLYYVTPAIDTRQLKGFIDVQRQIFELGQDADISTNLLKFNAPTKEVIKIQYVVQNAANNQGRGGNQQPRFEQTSSLFPLLQTDIDDMVEGNNSIVIDGASMYNPTTGNVEVEGYMDLCPIPDDETNITAELNTANGNAITYIGPMGSNQLTVSDQDLVEINTEFTGPKWVQVYHSGTVGQLTAAALTQFESYYLYKNITYLDADALNQSVQSDSISIQLFEVNGNLHWDYHAPNEMFLIKMQPVQNQQDPTSYSFSIGLQRAGGTIMYYQWQLILRFLNTVPVITATQNNIQATYPLNNIYIEDAGQDTVQISDILDDGIVWADQASKAWGRFKKFLRKCWKFLKNAIPIGSKVISRICPGPIGAGAAIIGDAVTAVDTAINAIGVSIKANQQFDTSGSQVTENDGKIVITPEYRIGSDIVDPTAQGTDWVESEEMLVDLQNYAQSTQLKCRHLIRNHPYYAYIQQARLQGRNLGDTTTKCQQRIKFSFRKAMSQVEAQDFKAALVLGSDTFYSDEQQ